MKTAIKRCLRGLTVILLIVVCGVFLLTGCRNKTPVLEATAPPEETAPPVFVEPELEEREVNIQTYYVIGEWANSRVVAGSEDTTYGPFRSQDFNVFTKWNPQANPGYAGSPGIIYLLEKECDLNKIVFTFSGKPYYFELYVSKDGEDYTLIADIDRTNAAQAYSNGICTLEGLALEGIRYVKLIFTGAEGGNTWVNLKEVEFFESGSKDLDTSWMIAEKPDTAVIVKGEPIGSWNKDHVNHGVNPMANSYDNDAETKWNPQALAGYTGNPGVIYTLDKPYNIKRIEVNLGSINHYFELYVSTDGRNYTRVANICTLNESRAYASGICKLDGLDLQNIQYVKMIFTGREDNGTWVNLFELSLYETGNGGSSADWRNPYIEKSLPITKAEISGLWNKDSVNHGQHPLQASYDNNLSTKWNPAANGGFSGEPGVVYTLDQAYTVKRFELTFTHDHHYFDLYVSADGAEYKKVAAISAENALKAYGSEGSLVCTLDGLAEENVKYVKVIFTGRVANTTWVNLVEIKILATGTEGLDTSWMLPYVEEPLKIVSGTAEGSWLYDNVEHAQHPLTASYDGNLNSKWNPAAKGGFAGDPGVVYTLEKADTLKRLELTFTHDHHYFDLYVSADGTEYTKIAVITAENALKAYGSEESLVCTLDGLSEENVKYIKLIFTGRKADTTWVNLVEVKAFHTGTGGLDTSWMLPESEEPEQSWKIVDAEAHGQWLYDNVEHAQHPLAASYDGNMNSKWNPAAKGGFAGDPGVVYTLEKADTLKRLELTFTHDHHYFDLYISADGTEYKKIAVITAENALKAYGSEESLVCTLDGLSEKKVKYIKLLFTGRKADTTWVNLVEVKAFHTGTEGLDTSWMLPESEEPEQSWKIVDAEAHGQWLYDNVEHAQHPLAASYDGNLNSKWNPAAKGGFAGNPGVVYTLEKADTLKRLELTFTHDHHYFDVFVSTDGTAYKKIAVITAENALKAYGSEESLVCTLDGLAAKKVKYIKLIFTGRKADTTWVNLVEVKVFNTGTEGLDTSWMLPESEEPEQSWKIVDAEAHGQWLYDNVEHAQHPLAASYDGNLNSKWNPAAKGGFAGDPGVVYALEKADTLKRLELTFTHDHHYFDVYVSADGTEYKKIAVITAENALKAYGSEESLVCTLDGLSEENVKYIKLIFTGRKADTTWVNLVEVKAFHTGTEGLDTSWMLPESEEPDEPTEPNTTEPETTEPETPDDGTPKIIAHNVIGAWVNDQIWDNGTDDLNVGPQLSYDGDPSTRWNPQASSGYAQEQGIIYTLNGWYDLEKVECTFSTADMYFEVYVSSDGSSYTKLGEVTDETLSTLYHGATCSMDGSEGRAVQFVKLLFTGRANNMDFVNLYEVKILGAAVEEPEATEPEVSEPEVTEPEVTEPETTEPEVTEPEALDPAIVSHTLIGNWILGREGDPNVGPQLSYDGNSATKWNPQASGHYAKEQGIIYTLNGLCDLNSVTMTFYSEQDMYFTLYGSSNGETYTELACVTAQNAAEYYEAAVCTVDVAAGEKIQYLKVLFTGRRNNSDYVNLYEVLITGTVWEEPDVTEPETTEPETTEPEETVPEETVQPVAAQITDFEVIGTWANDRIWDDGSNDLNTGPQLCCDGKTSTKWNPAVRSYTGAEGIIFTLDQLYDLQQLKLTFAAGEVMYFQLYGSADGVSYTPIVNVTAADTAMYANGVCTLEDIAADKFKYIKLLFTGKSNNSTWINFYEFDIMALPGEE